MTTTFDLFGYLRILRKRGWILAVAVLIGLALGASYALTAHRYYRATTTLQLNPSSTDTPLPYAAGNARSFAEIVASDAAYLKSRSFGELVVQQLKVPATPDQVTNAITTSLLPNTTVFTITVTWDNPRYAADIANGVAQIFITENLKRQEERQGAALSELQSSFDYYKARIEPLRQLRDQTQQQINQGDTSKLAQLNQLDAQLHNLEDTYSKLLSGLNAARASLNTATVIDAAMVPTRSTGPGLLSNLVFGSALGFVIGLGIVCLLEYLDTTIKGSAEVQRITGSSPLAMIGVISGDGKNRGYDSKLVTVHSPRDSITESFRGLRTSLSFLATARPVRHLVITSTLAQEGKTVIASNLAVSLAQAGKRVILVDGDLRVPSVHSQFGISNVSGFSELLAAESREDMLQLLPNVMQRSGVDGLVLLPSGPIPPNPAELLGSKAMDAVMAELEKLADVVIYDTPPMVPVTDAVVLAAKVDWSILVARCGRVRRDLLSGSVKQLQAMGVNLAGVLLNMVERSAPDYYHSYYYYYGSHEHGNGTGNGSSNGHSPSSNGHKPSTNGKHPERLPIPATDALP